MSQPDSVNTAQPLSTESAKKPDAAAVETAATSAVVAANGDEAVLAAAYTKFAEGAHSPGILILMERAMTRAKQNQFTEALELFTLARSCLTARLEPTRLSTAIANTHGKLKAECDEFARKIAARSPGTGRSVFVFSDSLGLPRPESASLADRGIPETYAYRIQELGMEKGLATPIKIVAACQRYFTTDDVVSRLSQIRLSLKSGFVLVHVGLNDCASRIFSEAERLAMVYVDDATKNLLLEFARVYRRPIIHRNPEYSYVPIERFVENLEKIVKISRSHGAQHVTFANIIQPGLKSETHTPHLRWNFTRYNAAIYDVAKRLSANVIDADRLCWSQGLDQTLNPDGIHLSSVGHAMLANRYVKLIAPELNRTV